MALLATIPVGPSFALHMAGKFRKKPVSKCPPQFKPSITAVIPAKNEMENIVYSLASLNKQTYKPNEIYVMDDASSDATSFVSRLFSEATKMNIKIRTRDKSQGKTSSLKEIVRESNSDLIFVLDADTILRSENYLERLVEAHYDKETISACGIVKSTTRKDKISYYEKELAHTLREILRNREKNHNREIAEKEFEKINPRSQSKLQDILRLPTITYRKGLLNYVQNFLNSAEQRLFKTTLVPVGCGVLYKRKKLKDLFDRFEQKLGDNLTNSEDTFIGFGVCNDGHRNVQLSDVTMSTIEPKITHLLKQTYLWSSAYLQSSYYFSDLLKTPFSYLSRKKRKKRGKPIGWVTCFTILEKIAYPCLLVGLGVLIDPWLIPLTIAVEHGIYAATNSVTGPRGEKLRLTFDSIISFPIRLVVLMAEFYTTTRFAYDLARGNRNWKK